MKLKLKSILAVALCAVGLAAFAESAVVAQFVKGGEEVAKFATAEAAVAALDDEQYADIEEFRIGLAADTVFDFGGRTNRVVIGNVGDVENTLKNVLLDCAGDYVVTGMVGTVVFGDGVRIEKETGFMDGLVTLIIKGGLYKSDPSYYCEGGYFGARRCDANPSLNGLYAILPKAKIAVTDSSKSFITIHYATLQDAFNLMGENTDVTLRLFNNLELGTAVTKLEGNKFIHLLPGEAGTNTIKRVGAEPVIEIGREAKLEIKNVIFDGANVTSENPMIEVASKITEKKLGWLIAGDGFVVSNAVGGAVHVGKGGKFELDGVAKIFENFTDGKPKNVIIEDSAAIQLTACGAVTDGNYAQIGVWSDNPKLMVAGRQFGTVNTSYVHATDFADGDISVEEPWVGFINDLDGTLHHAAGAAIAAAGKNTYKRWVGGKYKELVEEGDHLRSREQSIVSVSPELIWTARQEAPAAELAPAVLDWTDTTLTLAVSNGCDYALVTDGMAETNWVSMVGTDNTYAFARPAGDDYLCLRRYSITPSNIVSAATAYSVRVAAGTEGDPWLVGEGIVAWTNGTEFVVSGDGTVSDLSKLASKVTVESLKISNATVTGAEDGAFTGFSNVSLTLPDGWQGELPDEDGNWYGATVTLTAMPLTVKNVTFLQRYPWNGFVDVGFTLTGPVGETNIVVTAYTNGTVKVADFTASVTIPADGVLATNLVWDAMTAGLAANFKSDDVTVEMKIDESDIAAKSAAGALDLTVGDRVAAAEEPIVADPKWGDASEATVEIEGEEEPRKYNALTIDTWDTTTAKVTPGRYEMTLTAGAETGTAAFWKIGEGWVVFNSSNVTADVVFESGKTYLVLGTNTANSANLMVEDRAKFFYGEGVPSGFKGGTVTMSKRYEQKTVGDLIQIIEKTPGSEDNPWEIGEGVTAYTNGNELVIGGAGTVGALSGVDGLNDLLAGLTAINVTSNGVTGVASDAFQGVGGGTIALTLPDGWQGELPDEGGNWYGATVDMDNFVYPLTVKNVTFQQRYPWNDKVDIGFGVTGPEGEKSVVITAYTNGTVKIASYVAAVTIPADGVLATNLVWDAEAAGLAANFKSDDVTVEVKIAESDIAAKSEAGALDLTVGDRVAKDEETLVVDPAWDETDPTSAKVLIDGEDEPRTYTCASNDLWQTASLEPGRYEAELMTTCSSCVAGFWKVGDDWTVFDSSNITADVTFESGKTYLVLGTNTADGVTLKVEDGAKFAYDKGAPAGFLGGAVNLPTRYEQKTVEGEFYQIVEKIKGCEGNPWVVGEGVTAYTNGTELVIGGAGTVGALSGVDGLNDLLAGLTAINVTSNGVTGAEAQAFADVGTAGGSVSLTLPDGWQGELPDADGNWYGATDVTLKNVPLTVKNVEFLQRYPWNGLVDVGFTLTGPAGETNVIVTVRDGEAAVTNFTAAVTIPADGVLETNLVWDAVTAGLAANFKSDDVTVDVAFQGGSAEPAGTGGATEEDYQTLISYEHASELPEGVVISGTTEIKSVSTPFGGKVNCIALKNSYLTDKKFNENAVELSVDGGFKVGDKIVVSGFQEQSEQSKIVLFSVADDKGTTCLYTTEVLIDGGTSGLVPPEFTYTLEQDVEKVYIGRDAKHTTDVYTIKVLRSSKAEQTPAISAKSAAGTVDLRTNVALAEGETMVPIVTWSATAWGAVPGATSTGLGYTNKTTGASGVIAEGLVGENWDNDVPLPQKDGDYLLTHSTGDLTSFVTFTVSGYPLGSEGNPWTVGPSDNPDGTVAWTDGNGNVYFKPARSAVSREGLDAVTNAMGDASFPAKLISEDGSETNDLVMVLGASGTVYDTIAEALYADEASCTLFDVNGYLVSYNGGEGALGTMATDTFIPTVPTNLTANAYEIIGYRFDGWTNAVAGVFYTNRQEGVDFAQPGETLALTALWTQVELEPTGYDELTNMLAKVTRPLTITLNADIEIPLGGKIVVPAGKDVTFDGIGKFDVSAERPALFCGFPVGTGLKPEDLDRFKTDKDVKAYYEDGKVVVSGRGETEEFPWLLGTAGHEDEVTAWAGDEMILTKPTRGTASVAAFQSVTNALNGFVPGLGQLKVISADGAVTNDVVMLLGSDGVPYDTLADVLAADPLPETVRLFEVNGYFVSYDGNGAAGAMATDMFIPTIQTNLTANAYTAVGYAFAGWTTNGSDEVAFADRAEGVDFAQPGETLALKAKWTANDYAISYSMDDGTPFGAWAEGYTAPTAFSVTNNATLPVKANVDEANFLFNAWTNDEGVVFATTDGLFADLAVYADVTRLWSVKLPTVAHATCVASTNGVPLAAGRKVVDGATVTFALTPDAGYVLEGPSVYTATARADDVMVATDDTKIKKIVAVEIRPTEHATFAAEVADGGSYVAFDANPTNLIEGMVFRVTAAPMAGYEYVTAPEGWELADGLVSATFTIGTDDVTVDVPEPTVEPQVVFCRIAGAVDPGQLALCSEFAAYLRSVTRTDEEVWIPVDPATGAFDVTDIPAGTWQVEVYGVRAADGKEFLLCEAVEILEDDLAFELPMPDLTLPYVVSAAVDASEAGEFAAVGASGLKELATDIAVDEANDVTVVLKVEEVDVATDTNAQAIAAAYIAAGNTNELEFVELTVLKQVGVAAPEQVGELPQCIEVVIPYPTRGRKNFAVWSNHAGEVAPLRRVRTFRGDEEGFMVGDGKIIVHAKRFSTYAIGSEAGDDLSVLYPNGDGGVFVKSAKATVYEGVTLDETGVVVGSVAVKLGKPNKKGEMTVSATVKTLADKQTYMFKPETKKVSADVNGPLVLTLVGSNTKSKAHTFALAIKGDSLTGTFDACTVDGARNVFKVSKDPKRDRLAPFVGYWTLAFVTATSVDATCRVQVSKNGSVHIHGRLADGTLICCHPKAEVGDDWIAAPATVRKVVKGQVKTFAFRVAFDEVTRTVSAVNVSPVVIADKKTLAVVSETPVTAVEGGQPKLTKAAVKTMTFGAEGREAPVKSSVKLNATRGELTGTLTWKTPNAKGRMVSETGKVYGIDIGGVLYGSVFFSKTGETRALVVGD